MSLIRTAFEPILSTIFPEQCRVCFARESDLAGGVVCEDCWRKVEVFTNETTLCVRCGAILANSQHSAERTCRNCEKMAFDRAVACGAYEGAISASILALKRRPLLASRLEWMIRSSLDRTIDLSVDIIIPVPLAQKRARERGFNQAEVIARVVSRHLNIPTNSTVLQRVVNTPQHRAGMDRRARELSVEKAFKVSSAGPVEGKSVLLTDDVLTSGATADACSAVLKKNGASSVTVFTIARAVHYRH